MNFQTYKNIDMKQKTNKLAQFKQWILSIVIPREYTGFKTECGVKIFVGDTLKVVLRNNCEFTGKVSKEGKDFCVDIGRKLILAKCYKDEYNTGLDTYHKKCGWRYAAFYVAND